MRRCSGLTTLRAGQSGALTREGETVDGAQARAFAPLLAMEGTTPTRFLSLPRRAEPSRVRALCVSCWRSVHLSSLTDARRRCCLLRDFYDAVPGYRGGGGCKSEPRSKS